VSSIISVKFEFLFFHSYMGLVKLVLVMLLFWLGFVLFKKMRQLNVSRSSDSNIGQKMIVCSVCDTHIPESEAIIKDGKIYCSKDCL